MAVRNGQQFKAGLKDGREVWYDGKRVDDVTTFPEFQAAIQSIADLYDLQHDPAQRDVLTCEVPDLGVVGRAFEMPRTHEHLRLKREAYMTWARANC
ncbi:MAG: 4-hydroxyphenylacetate 3-hydroxylase N-terminal domain-containing protein, partial [Gammaproteobacteria bacterium]